MSKIYFKIVFLLKNFLNLKRSTINYEKQNKNKRIKILVISIIILLILMVIAMIITWIIILKLNDTTDNRKTSITTENINSNSGTNFLYPIEQ